MQPLRLTTLAFALSVLALLLTLPLASPASYDYARPLADGATAVLTPQGTWITPPPGAPMLILPAESSREETDERTIVDEVTFGALACTRYQVGWYETNSVGLHGGHAGIKPQNLPPNTQHYCTGMGMGYTAGVSFGSNSWIQAGLALFPGETAAKWFCQANDSGAKTTRYGSANAYGNNVTVYTWFARDSSGIWRTYRYDTGPYSIELPCAISRGAGGSLQVYGEIQGATSTSAPMGPWAMLDLRYLPSTGSQWYVPSQLATSYVGSTPCPPYGAGTVSGGTILAGTSRPCTVGTSAYPN
jgi:hypothetical protein